jgi:hypothetical protein
MVCKGSVIVLLTSLAEVYAKEADAIASMDELIDSLLTKGDHVSPAPRADLDETTLGKAGNLAVQSGSRARLTAPASSFQPRAPPAAAPAAGARAEDLPQVKVFGSMSDMRKRFESLKTRATAEAEAGTQRKLRVAVVGGGPSGSCAAEIFAEEPNIETFLFERKMDNCKPCGGAIPYCMVSEFDLPENIIDRKVTKMTMISPTNKHIDIGSTLKPNEYIGMTRREVIDGYLRDRAISKGVKAYNALVMSIDMPKTETGPYTLNYNLYAEEGSKNKTGVGVKKSLRWTSSSVPTARTAEWPRRSMLGISSTPLPFRSASRSQTSR